MRKNIFIVSVSSFYGGGEVFLARLLSLLCDFYNLKIISPTLDELDKTVCTLGSMLLSPSDKKGLWFRLSLIYWFWQRRGEIKKENIIIILNGRGAAYFTPFILALLFVKPIVIAHTELSMRTFDLKELLFGFSLKFSKLVIAVSDSLAMQHKRRWPKLNIVGIPNWIDNINDDHIQKSIDRKFSKKGVQLAVVGRWVLEKGVLDIINVCADAKQNELHIYGDGPLRKDIELIASNNRWLHIHGYVENISLVLSKHDILISASYSESFSFSVAEGVCSGLLCVVTNIPAHVELLGESYPKELFFSPGNLSELKKSIDYAKSILCENDGIVARDAVFSAIHRIKERNSVERARKLYIDSLSFPG